MLNSPRETIEPDVGEETRLVRLPVPTGPARPTGTALAHTLLEGRGWTPLRVAVDFAMAALAAVAAAAGAADVGLTDSGALLLAPFPFLVLSALALRGMYGRRLRVATLDGIGLVAGAVSVSAMLVITAGVLGGVTGHFGALVARAWLFAVLFVGAGRATLAAVQRSARSRREVGRATLIVGAGTVGAQVARRLRAQPEYGLVPVGFLDADPSPQVERTALGVPILGTPDELARVASEVGAEHVILAFSSAPDHGLVPVIRRCEQLDLQVSLVPRLFESITDRVALERLGGLPLLGLRAIDPAGWHFAAKYALDRLLALGGILVALPMLLAVAAAVKLSSPGPVLFRQRRVGRDGQAFDLLKFRSMRGSGEDGAGDFTPAPGAAPGGVEGRDRRTPVGRFIRRTSLDELPQLFNVLRGEMSLVGPRPERPEFVELFEHDVARYGDRHRVKSGITGWAQVHGLRGQTSLADRVEWDNFYIENWSFGLDLKILLMTASAMVRPHD